MRFLITVTFLLLPLSLELINPSVWSPPEVLPLEMACCLATIYSLLDPLKESYCCPFFVLNYSATEWLVGQFSVKALPIKKATLWKHSLSSICLSTHCIQIICIDCSEYWLDVNNLPALLHPCDNSWQSLIWKERKQWWMYSQDITSC